MLTHTHIQNFKSIRDVSFDAKRVNVFIGEPNTGKTNILEAIALLSKHWSGETLREIFRYRTPADLFFDQEIKNGITLKADGQPFSQEYTLKFDNGLFSFSFFHSGIHAGSATMYPQGDLLNWVNAADAVRLYKFKEKQQLNLSEFGSLTPPFGRNLVSILYTNKELREMVADLFRTRNFRLEIRPTPMEIWLTKVVGDIAYSFTYEAASETWRRIIFYMAVLETNKDSTILLDEPEANTFPFYTKYLAERIALDESNQFFITTHNPYLLSSIVEKTPQETLAVFVARMDNFATTLKPVSAGGLSKILDYGPDAFLNLDKLTEA
ncbi:MAG: AAA family ATPase [Verrucomicrobia bacterium]|nr:AAA family ATPase [Verrucomicrobiota bacterium]MDE3099580.1 AAA family ATPase [Verrucomicrobiota bacterium]